jgi:hypothetical protein
VNCLEVRQHLSAYHDGELPKESAAEVVGHLQTCPDCSAELASFEQLSKLSRHLASPHSPSTMWGEIQTQLDEPTEIRSSAPSIWSQRPTRLFAAAAAILFAVLIGSIAYKARLTAVRHDHLADHFAGFLREFDSHPETAQQILMTNYDGSPTTFPEATAILGYEPIAANGLPRNYSVDQVYLLKMPCCTCAEVVCRRQDGQPFVIFEHDTEQPNWFGDRPSLRCLCHDVSTNVIQVGDKIAATWKYGSRFVTVIGLDDLTDVADFVAFFSGSDALE